ncbi:MAG: hypothetical protein ACFFFH_19165 [Candidatus Thorarchaeota archaeon]
MSELIFGGFTSLIPLITINFAFIIIFFSNYVSKKAHGNFLTLIVLGANFIQTIFVLGEELIHSLLPNTSDERVIDLGIIQNSTKEGMKIGRYLRRIQTGVVEFYSLCSLGSELSHYNCDY